MKYHRDGSLPTHGEVFVFGSNVEGVHGAGAAKAALDFGARWGIGMGRVGNTYAIPTKGMRHSRVSDGSRLYTLPLSTVRRHIHEFLDYAMARPGEEFFITRIGCGLAGFKDYQIAPMFGAAPPNCSVAEEWRAFIEDIRA